MITTITGTLKDRPNASSPALSTPSISNFVMIESIYGKFIVNRYCHFQAEALIKTGRTHIENELGVIFQFIDRLPDHSIVIDGGTNIGFSWCLWPSACAIAASKSWGSNRNAPCTKRWTVRLP